MKSIIPALHVADIDASIRFYTDVLGFTVAFTVPGANGKLAHASLQRGDALLMFGGRDLVAPEDRAHLGKGVVLYTTVGDDEDVDALYEHAKAAGATIVQEPTDQYWGHRDWGIADPDGYRLTVSKEIRAVSRDEMREAMAVPAD